MFDTRNMAMDGFYPGLAQPFSIAILGTYEIEVIITPVVQTSGGGFVGAPLHFRAKQFKVTVRIKFNGIWYEDTHIMDEKQARVMAKLKGIKSFSTNNVMVSVNGVQIFEQEEITVKINSINIENQSGIIKTNIQ